MLGLLVTRHFGNVIYAQTWAKFSHGQEGHVLANFSRTTSGTLGSRNVVISQNYTQLALPTHRHRLHIIWY